MSWMRDYSTFVDNLKEEVVIFGKFDVAEDFLQFNPILLLGKFYIYSWKCQNGVPSLQGFIAILPVFIISNSILPGKETIKQSL